MKGWLGFLLCFVGVSAGAASPEMEIAERIAARCGYAQIGYDAEGHVTGLLFRTAKAYSEPPEWLGEQVKEVETSVAKTDPQLTDADLPELRKLPHLKFLKLDGMSISGAGYWSLQEFQQLEYLGLHCIDRTEIAHLTDPSCVLVMNKLPRLRRFDYKHNFRLTGVPADQLQGTDRLEYLHLDNACCGPSVVPLILACPNLRRLELHRTTMTPADLERIVATNQRIADLRIRPLDERGLQPSHLALLTRLPALETLCFGGNYNEMAFDYDNDLVYLTQIKTLKNLTAPIRKKEDDSFRRLNEALGGIQIQYEYY
jgi:hypothetical protein